MHVLGAASGIVPAGSSLALVVVGPLVPALLDAVDRVAQGQALDVAPAPAPTAPVVEELAPSAIEIEVVSPEPAVEAEIATGTMLEPVAEAEVGVEAETEAVAAIEPDVETATEAETEWLPLSVAGIEPVAGSDDAIAVAEPDAVAEDEGVIAESAVELAWPETVEAVSTQADEMQPEPEEVVAEAPALDVGAIIEYAVACVEPVADEPAEPAVPDEICIGPVCLSTGLYEIFMAEAHQRLAVLQEEAERQADIANSAINEHARRAIHTLGGIAGTAGITVLANLSHALEQYWNRFVHVPLPSAHLPLVQDTVARLHEMVATIESGHLPEAAHDLIAALGELEDEQAMPDAESIPLLVEDAAEEHPAPAIEAAVEPEHAGEAMPVEAASESESGDSEPGETHHINVVSGPLDVSALVPDIKPVTPVPVFERREVADEIDQQLLPIFLEEADTLVPDTSAQLRAWKAKPDAAAARDALRRNLHTNLPLWLWPRLGFAALRLGADDAHRPGALRVLEDPHEQPAEHRSDRDPEHGQPRDLRAAQLEQLRGEVLEGFGSRGAWVA